MYTNNVTCVSWNGVRCRPFYVKNGLVTEVFIVSPVLFCVYFDGLLQMIRESDIGCFVGDVYVDTLAYVYRLSLIHI